MTELLKGAIVLTIVFGSTALLGNAYKPNALQNFIPSDQRMLSRNDSIPYAKAVLYRPDNQWSRKFKIATNTNGTFEMANNEVVHMAANADLLTISVDAAGHKKSEFTFHLRPNTTHYFRIQDRNNYASFRPRLEVVEVTEDTFNREKL